MSKAWQYEVRELSSRADVNARSARFVYNYGDFSGDKKALTWKYEEVDQGAWLEGEGWLSALKTVQLC